MPEHFAPSRPVRLVLLLQDLFFGGTQRQTLELARRLDPTRFRPEIWVLMAGEDLASLPESWGIPLRRLSRDSWVGPRGLANLWKHLKNMSVDLLMPLTPVPNIWGRILGRLAGTPLIIGNCRGLALYRQHEELLWPLAHHLICNAAALKVSLTRTYGVPAHRISVIHNGVDSDFFRPPASHRAGPPIVLSVARLAPDKDHETLIRAFAAITDRHPAAQLWLLGDGPRLKALQGLTAELLPPERLRFISGQADLRPFLAQAHLFALSSCREAFPNTVLEAMSTSLPVVATRVGGLPEMVVPGETGWLTPRGDVSSLASALEHLLNDAAARQAFGRAGRERAVRCFPLDAMVRRHEELMLELLRRHVRYGRCEDLGLSSPVKSANLGNG